MTLIRLTEDWKYAADKGHASVILSTDISKAFDSLHPNLLLAKLKAYGLSDSALGLMRSYFDDRENRTRIGNNKSAWKAVKRGCPPGSSLDRYCGMCIKMIYSTLHGVKSQLSAYADDHQIYCSNLNLHRAIDRIKKDGEEASRWYKTNLNCKAIITNTKQWVWQGTRNKWS